MSVYSHVNMAQMILHAPAAEATDVNSSNMLDQQQYELHQEYIFSASPLLQDSQGSKRNLLSITILFSCVYGIAVMILTNLTLTTLINDTKQLLLISDNWHQRSIVDIVSLPGSCPEEYENIIKGLYLGTNTGCDCQGVSSAKAPLDKWDSLFSDRCSNMDRKSGCHDIPSVEPLEINSIQDIRICAKRAGPNLLEMGLYPAKCNEDYRLCNSTLRCEPAERKCPITDIQIVSNESDTPVEYTALTFNSSHKLIFARQEDRLPVISFKFEEEQPCIDPDEYPSPLDASWHKLDKKYGCSVKIAGNMTNYRYKKFLTVSSFELYSSSTLLSKLKKVPYYDVEKFQQYQRSLYWSSWISWDLECERTSGHFRQAAVEHINEVKDIANEQDNIFDLVWYGYFIIAALNYIIWVESPKPRTRKFWNKVRQTLLLIFSVFQLTGLIQIVWRTQMFGSSIEFFKGVKCSDSLGNHSFHHITESLRYTQYADILAIMVILLTLMVEVGSFLIEHSMSKHKKE